MKLNLSSSSMSFPTCNDSILTHRCSGPYLQNIGRYALLAVALGLSAMLETGCSSTEEGFRARLTGSAPTTRRVTESEDDGGYQPTRSPAFDPDLFGG
jgi:hypothetical protein